MNEEQFFRIEDIYERMSDDARRRCVEQDLLDIKSPEQLAKSRTFVNNIISQNIISANGLAKRTGIKPSAISAFRTDKWKGSAGTLYTTATKLCAAIDQFLKEQEAEETAIAGYVTTRFALAIRDLVQLSCKRRDIAAFTAPAGQGKTTVLGAMRESMSGSVLVTVGQRRASPKSFLQIWARALGLLEVGRAEDLQDRIVTCLYGSGRLVMVDECHKLQVSTLDVIREIWDAAHMPVVLAGTTSFYKILTTRRLGIVTSELMDQLFSRVAFYRDLSQLENPDTGEPEPLNSPEDIRKLFARGKVRLRKDAADFLCQYANVPGFGALRSCHHLVQTVIDLWEPEEITADLLQQAMRLKIGAREAAHQISVAEGMSLPSKMAAVG